MVYRKYNKPWDVEDDVYWAYGDDIDEWLLSGWDAVLLGVVRMAKEIKSPILLATTSIPCFLIQ
jgi:hypothetical protein